MKNEIFKSFLLSISLSSLLALSSCEDFLNVENPSTVSQIGVFNSVSYTESSIVGVYNQLIGDNGYGSRISLLYPQAADDFKTSGDFNPLDRRGLSGYGASPDNTELNQPFLQLYRGIERANICIKYIPLSDLYTSGTPAQQAQMKKMHGEALTLRAQFYYELIRNWGDVPAQFEPSSDIPNLYLAKTDRDEIFDRLLEDLAMAADLVPWRSESGDPATRITKAAVKGLRARIALARGGYSLRREPQIMIRRDDYRTYYQIALDETRAIIERGESGLNANFESLFKTLHSGNRQDPTNEMIFEVGAFGGNARTDSKLGYSNGIRINANSSYGTANGGVVAIPTYFYAFDSIADTRRDVTLAYFEIDASDNKVVTAANDMRDGKFRKYWTSINGTNQSLGVNWPILRYADVLLMFAEADNEINGSPSQSAKDALEAVRKRAYLDQYETHLPAMPSDKDGFFNALVKERLLEFGGEGIRKYDLIRWNLLGTTIEKTRTQLREFMNGTGRYANVPQYVYLIPTKLKNTTVAEDIADLDIYGGSVATAMYTPAPASAPSGYTRKNWRAGVNENYITGAAAGYAIQFEANRKELFPIFTGILNQNFNLTQDYGY